MAVQEWKSKLVRWHQLTRYYANKWQYDSAKWAERIWYGTGPTVPNAVASVPFMITRNMRAQLESAGFPSHEISALVPKVAHQLVSDKISYAQFQTERQRYAETPVAMETKEIEAIVATIQAREAEAQVPAAEAPTSTKMPSAVNQIAIVPDQTKEKEGERL